MEWKDLDKYDTFTNKFYSCAMYADKTNSNCKNELILMNVLQYKSVYFLKRIPSFWN